MDLWTGPAGVRREESALSVVLTLSQLSVAFEVFALMLNWMTHRPGRESASLRIAASTFALLGLGFLAVAWGVIAVWGRG
jgi:hypothetical protein